MLGLQRDTHTPSTSEPTALLSAHNTANKRIRAGVTCGAAAHPLRHTRYPICSPPSFPSPTAWLICLSHTSHNHNHNHNHNHIKTNLLCASACGPDPHLDARAACPTLGQQLLRNELESGHILLKTICTGPRVPAVEWV